MVGKTAAERKAAERDRRKNSGLARYEFWLTREEGRKVTRYLLKLRRLLNQGATNK